MATEISRQVDNQITKFMKYKTVQEKITAIYSWAIKNHVSAIDASQKKNNVIEKAMIRGKAAAYMDVAQCIKGKYGKYIIE